MNIIFHVQGSLRRNEKGELNYYGGKSILRHFKDTVCFDDIRETACALLGESGTEMGLRYAVEDILCELQDGMDFFCLKKAYRGLKNPKRISIYVLSSYGKKNDVSSTRVRLESVTPIKPCELDMVLTPQIDDCLTKTSRKRPRSTSVVRKKLIPDTVVRSEDCPSQMLFDVEEVLSSESKFSLGWFKPEGTRKHQQLGFDIRYDAEYARQREVTFRQAYWPLLEYFAEVSDVDGEAVSVLGTNKQGNFHRLFWTFGQLIHAYQTHLRKVVIIDSYPFGNTRGCVMTALGVDPDNRTFPLAFAIAETESEENWRFFLGLLEIHVLNVPTPQVIQTARHTVMTKWIPKYFPDALHVFCPFHLSEMISRKSPAAAEQFREAYHELDEETFSTRMSKIREINAGIHAELLDIGYEKWSDLYISKSGLSRFSINEFNHCRSWQMMTISFDSQPLPMFVECIRTKIAQHFLLYRARAAESLCQIGPTAKWMLEAESSRSIGCIARSTVGGKFLVNSLDPGSPHTVDMIRSTCTCNFWQVHSLPCAHALACLGQCGPVSPDSPYDLVSKFYSTSTLIAIYDQGWFPTRSVTRVPFGSGCVHCLSKCPKYTTGLASRWFEQAMDEHLGNEST